jgi:hypothetical protein
MRLRLAEVAAFAVALVLGATLMIHAQDKASPQKMSNIQGKVGRIEKDTIVIMIGTNPKPVMFSAATKFLAGHTNDNKPGTIAEVKQGYFIACSGSVGDKAQFMAKECVYRDKQ